ncbi:MAG: inverse autotransporter beta domain-containing protein [Chlamydiia bacterium]|nr:inverse autotransporter beta domain-containing protein [Chlamydiia bacterium]
MFRYVFLATVLSLSGFADDLKKDEACPDGKKHYRATVRHIESGGIGYDNGYTTLEAFLAPDPSQWKVTPFLDARGHLFDNGKWAANAGIGLRILRGNWVYGINTYYDYRNPGRFNSNQIGVGLETLGQLFDFRINGYLPIGTKTSDPYDSVFSAFSSHYMLVSQKIQSAMKGANAEFGFHFGQSEFFDFYAAAGPYYFIGKAAPATWGGKARLLGVFKDIVTLEISDSYDRTFHNKFQGQIALSVSLGPKSKIKEQGHTCKVANTLNDRMLQPVDRQEIVVIDNTKQNAVAINPATGQPYFFVFVNNTSSSNGTYESPYHSLAQAQNNSSPNDIIYVFPGNGTTAGMDSGIALKAYQKLWGSGISHSIQTSQGTISIPAQSSSSPIITNTNFDTDGNAITLATHNAISGMTLSAPLNDAIFGTNPQSLEVSSCTFKNTTTFPIEASFSGDASISLTNNQFLNNDNGVFLTLNGASTITCSNNTFEGQTSVSSPPLEIVANSNTFTMLIEKNLFQSNTTGSIRFNLTDVVNADIIVLNNTMANNDTGAEDTLGSNLTIIPNGTTAHCSITLTGNTFSHNTSNSLYVHTSGTFTTLETTATSNTMANNGKSALAFGSGCTNFTLNATNNTLTNLNDNGIAVVGGTPFQTANITINKNTITNIGNSQSAIAIAQGSSSLNFTMENNTIDQCTGSGVFCFASEFTNMTANITGNGISNCQNGGSNAASGISLDTYVTLTSTIANNSLSANVSPGVAVGFFTTGNPTVCLTLTGNSSNTDPGYLLNNPGMGAFNVSPCNVVDVNTGTISLVGGVTYIQSCPEGAVCP